MSNRNTTGYIKTCIFCSRNCAFQPLESKEKNGVTFFFFFLAWSFCIKIEPHQTHNNPGSILKNSSIYVCQDLFRKKTINQLTKTKQNQQQKIQLKELWCLTIARETDFSIWNGFLKKACWRKLIPPIQWLIWVLEFSFSVRFWQTQD